MNENENEIDVGNSQGVSLIVGTGQIAVLAPKHAMTRAEALVHAAWLITVVGDDDEFKRVLQAVRNT